MPYEKNSLCQSHGIKPGAVFEPVSPVEHGCVDA